MLEKLGLAKLDDVIPLIHIGITAGIFLLAGILSKLAKRLVKKVMKQSPRMRGRFGKQLWESEQDFILRSISWIIWLGFVISVFYVWQGYIGKAFVRIEHLYAPIARSLVIIIIAALALKSISLLIRLIVDQLSTLAERNTARGRQRVETLNHIFQYSATFIILLVAVLMLLDTFGIDLKAVLATVGVASLAVGFGAQSLVKDIVSGIFILIEDQFAVGDVIVVDGEGGFVEKMTLRITQLRNTEGTLLTVPNGTIGMVKNLTSEWSRVDYMIGVAYETNLDHAMDVLMEEAVQLRKDMPKEILDDPERLGVDAFGDSSITLRLWIKTVPLKQWVVKREFNRRVHKRFEQEGIEIPFPQRTLWIREPKEALLASLVEQHTQAK